MKKLLFFAAALFAAVSFSACSDDKEDGNPDYKDVKLVKSIDVTGDIGLTNSRIQYDGQNRVVKFSNADREYNYEYDGSTLTVTDSSNPENVIVATLNAGGYITNATWNYDDGGRKSSMTFSFTYDKNGYLISSKDDNDEYIYTWKDGNLMTITAKHDDGDTHKTTFTYGAAQSSMNLDLTYHTNDYGSELGTCGWLGLLGFLGRPSKNLCERCDDGGLNTNYLYQFNTDGTVSQMDYKILYSGAVILKFGY